nr:MAG TPA: hypothetical protein [Bacteriophage sp.]
MLDVVNNLKSSVFIFSSYHIRLSVFYIQMNVLSSTKILNKCSCRYM